MFNYDNMLALSESKKEFTKKTEIINNRKVDIFTYNVMMSTTFDSELAKEFRGCVFDVETKKCICRPFPKFFNVNEHEESKEENINWDNVIYCEKHDGSITMPVLFPDGSIFWKSKSSFFTDHAIMANNLFQSFSDEKKNEIKKLLNKGFTPLFELVSPNPKFRIVIEYEHDDLIYLGMRNISSGEYKPSKVYYNFSKSSYHDIENMQGIEGYVLWDGNKLYKKKTIWYLQRHKAIYNISYRSIIESTLLNDSIDDIIGIVAGLGMKEKLNEILTVRDETVKIYISEQEKIEKFYSTLNKNYLDRKEFAMDVHKLIPKIYWKFMFAIKDEKDYNESLKDLVQEITETKFKNE